MKNDYEIKVQVVENSGLLGLEMKNYLNRQKSIRLTGGAKNIEEAFKLLSLELPDVVILDISTIGGDALRIIKRLTKITDYKINVVLIYDIANYNLVSMAKKLGVKYNMLKPIQLDVLYNNIIELGTPFLKQTIPFNDDHNNTDENIDRALLSLRIPVNNLGYRYLHEAIRLVSNEPKLINHIVKTLYPKIAEKYLTTATRVERAIRHAIGNGWKLGGLEELNTFFGYKIYSGTKNLTNGQLIALLSITINKTDNITKADNIISENCESQLDEYYKY